MIDFNGQLFWFSLIVLIFSITYLWVVKKERKILGKMSIEDYAKYYKEKYHIPNSYDLTYADIEIVKKRELDEYNNVTLDKIKYFSLLSLIALVLSIFWGNNFWYLLVGHILNWISVANLFWKNYKFKQYWKEVVSKVIAISSIIFVPVAFYFTILFEVHMETLATYVTIFGFPITLASILTFIRPSK